MRGDMPNTVASRRLIAAGCLLEQRLLHFDLVAAVERHRSNRRLLGAELSSLADAVPAVGNRQDDALIAAEQRQHVDDRLLVRRGCGERIAIAQRGTDQRGKRNDDVGVLHERPHRLHRSHVAADDGKVRVIAHRRKAVLPVHEVVDDGDGAAALEQCRHQHRPEISCAARDKDLGHLTPSSTARRRSISAVMSARMVADKEPALVRRLRVVDVAHDVVVEKLDRCVSREAAAGDHPELDVGASKRVHHARAIEIHRRVQDDREAEPRARAILALDDEARVVFEQPSRNARRSRGGRPACRRAS